MSICGWCKTGRGSCIFPDHAEQAAEFGPDATQPMTAQARRIFNLEAENTRLRRVVREIAGLSTQAIDTRHRSQILRQIEAKARAALEQTETQ